MSLVLLHSCGDVWNTKISNQICFLDISLIFLVCAKHWLCVHLTLLALTCFIIDYHVKGASSRHTPFLELLRMIKYRWMKIILLPCGSYGLPPRPRHIFTGILIVYLKCKLGIPKWLDISTNWQRILESFYTPDIYVGIRIDVRNPNM